ncbi:hypothetical protein CDV36_010580 [Fusarium kuroshium]|uniref:RRM domain-containing protein n=1 Tax=Fusarium kuroshium TaxID=2010991 RepID=A0A3M2RX22_9HYPO|nr:hypothetical protein CDV36_010580 [Fusarium kuroshium]
MVKSKRAREATEAEDKNVTPVVDIEAPPKKRKRNEDDAVTAEVKKKAKKEKKDKKHKKESRKERKDKRKNLQDLPDQDEEEEEQDGVKQEAEDSPMTDADVKPASATADAADSDKAAKKKKNKKDKKNKEKESQQQEEEPTADAEANDESSSKKKKKNKKDKKSSSETTTNNNENDEAVPNGADEDTAAADADSKADRHIVFVGNLPFTATADTIQAHFASLSPIHVRCMSDPADTKPCRGFAFVEFAKVWHMRTCLDKFHHSMFEDGVSPARRINVELTAGGGGKTKRRQEKIHEKNRKLNENRTKRIERERNAKEEARANGNTSQQQHLEDAIHPSRRGRVPGNAW